MKKYNSEIPGYTNERELYIISVLASYVKENGSILEIGSFLGRSTSALYLGKKDNVQLDIVDSFEGKFTPFDLDIVSFDQSYAKGNSILFKEAQEIANKSNWLEAFRYCVGDTIFQNINVHVTKSSAFNKDKDYDLIFIDGSHKLDDVIFDLVMHSSDQTLLIGDDFHSRYLDVIQAVGLVRRKSTLIVFENTKLFAIVPVIGYWREVFKKNNLLFLV